MAGTINVANISIGFDASKLKAGGQFTRNEIGSLTKLMKDAEPAASRYARQVELLRRAYHAGGISAQQFANAQKHLNDQMNKSASQDGGGIGSAVGTMLKFGTAAAAARTAFGGLKTAVGLATEFETLKVQMAVLTGSTEAGSKLLAQMRKLDMESTLGMGDFMAAGKTLLAYGVTADKVATMLDALSKISVGDPEKMTSLALAFGQVTANGKLMGQELNQMTQHGFNPLLQLSKDLGVRMDVLRKDMENGAISADLVTAAFLSATTGTGQYAKMNEELTKTMGGQWAKLESDIKQLGTAIGNKLLPSLKEMVSLLRQGSEASKGVVGGTRSAVQVTRNFGAFANPGGWAMAANQIIAGSSGMAEKTEQTQKRITNIVVKSAEATAAANNNELKASVQIYEQAKRLAALKKQMDDRAIEAAKWIEEMDRDRASRIEGVSKRAMDLIKSPFNKLVDEIKMLEEAVSEGFISQTLFNEAQLALIDQFTQDEIDRIEANAKDNNPDNIANTIAPALKAGSAEAYKFVMDRQEKVASRAEQIAQKALEGDAVRKSVLVNIQHAIEEQNRQSTRVLLRK